MSAARDPGLVFNPPKRWQRCPRCGEEFTNLTPSGLCVNCAPEVLRQKKFQEEFKFPEEDRQSRAAGDNDETGGMT